MKNDGSMSFLPLPFADVVTAPLSCIRDPSGSCRRELYCIDATCLAERRVAIYNAKWQEVDAHAEQEVVRGKGIQKLAKAMPSASVGRIPRSTVAPKPPACETMEVRRFSTALVAPLGVLAPARENGNQSRDHFLRITFPI